jgi:hypothetical protein
MSHRELVSVHVHLDTIKIKKLLTAQIFASNNALSAWEALIGLLIIRLAHVLSTALLEPMEIKRVINV